MSCLPPLRAALTYLGQSALWREFLNQSPSSQGGRRSVPTPSSQAIYTRESCVDTQFDLWNMHIRISSASTTRSQASRPVTPSVNKRGKARNPRGASNVHLLPYECSLSPREDAMCGIYWILTSFLPSQIG